MNPAQAQAPFFKLAGLVLDEYLPRTLPAREREETRWAAIVVGLAPSTDVRPCKSTWIPPII